MWAMLVSAFIDPGEYRKTKTNVEPKLTLTTELNRTALQWEKGFFFKNFSLK